MILGYAGRKAPYRARSKPPRVQRTPMSTRLDSTAFGLACGIIWAGTVGFLELAASTGWGARWRSLLADVYPGYDRSPGDFLWGVLLGFLDGFLWGYSFAVIYNRLAVQPR